MPRKSAVALAALTTLLIAGSLRAAAQTNSGRAYRLDPSSTYQRGCFPPCLCPMMETGTLRGTFRLAPAATGDAFQFFSVQDVRWKVDFPHSPVVHRIIGSGTYKFSLGTNGRMHQMILDLAIDQNLPQHFDSGLIPMTTPFPKIDIAVSLHGGVCQDTVLTLHARPLLWVNVVPSGVSWEALPGATGYDLVQGDLGALHTNGGDLTASTTACLAEGTTVLSFENSVIPAPGHGFYFIARSEEGSAQETWDEGDVGQIRSRDPALQSAPAACP